MILVVLSLCTTLFGGLVAFFYVAYGDRHTRTGRLILKTALIVLSILALLEYTRFGALHHVGPSGSRNFHFHEIFHYFLGGRYFTECGYYNLYKATIVGLDELADRRLDQPVPFDRTRSLENKLTFISATLVRAERDHVKSLFQPHRWERFLNDLQILRRHVPMTHWWAEAVLDCGFNPSPAWGLVGGAVARYFPLSDSTWSWLGYFDWILVAIAAVLVGRYLDAPAACVFLLVFGTNFLSSYFWTGGSFFRHTWFLLLTAGMCMLMRRRTGWAGFFLGISAALRIFPVFFILGGALPLVLASQHNTADRRMARRYLFSAGAALLLSIGISSVVYGPEKWQDWIRNISGHKEIYFANHVGFKKIATFSPETGNQNFFGVEGEQVFGMWNSMLQARWEQHSMSNWIFVAASCTLLFLPCLRASPAEASLLVGTSLLFFTGMPANYYFVYFAAYAAILMQSTTPWGIFRFACLLIFLTVIGFLPLAVPDDIVRSAWVSLAVLILLGLLAAAHAAEQLHGLLPCSDHRLALSLATPSLFLIGAMVACSLMYAHRTQAGDATVLPSVLAQGKVLVDQIDIGQPAAEREHHFIGEPRTSTRRRLDRFGTLVSDDCRINASTQQFRLHGFRPGQSAQLILRSDLFFNVTLAVHIDGELAFSGARSRVGSLFEYITIQIPGDLVRRQTLDVKVSLPSGRDIGIFYVWALQNQEQSPPRLESGESTSPPHNLTYSLRRRGIRSTTVTRVVAAIETLINSPLVEILHLTNGCTSASASLRSNHCSLL